MCGKALLKTPLSLPAPDVCDELDGEDMVSVCVWSGRSSKTRGSIVRDAETGEKAILQGKSGRRGARGLILQDSALN